jgi:LL-diaminopimelate aminotransferase
MPVRRAERLDQIPPYIAFEIDRQKREAIAGGADVIDLGVGDPDGATPSFVVDAMAQAIRDPANHKYSLGAGVPEYRQAAADWFARRFGLTFDPQRELLPLIGSKDAIGHLALALVNPGEHVLTPDPGYPAYAGATVLAGGVPYAMPLTERDGWLPRFNDIPPHVCASARMMYLNYPNNPTGAVATLDFFERAVAFARRHNILLVHDAAYCELCFEEPSPSVMQVPDAKEVAIELHSLSKSHNMTGWRIGFAVGNAEALAALAFVKSQVDSGPFRAVQWAAVKALRDTTGEHLRALVDSYRRRRDLAVEGLSALGLHVTPPQGAFYLWALCPDGSDSVTFCQKTLAEAHVVLIPGVAFGSAGEGYFRMTLSASLDRIREALNRMKRLVR